MKTIRTRPVLPLPFLALAFVLAASAVQAASFVVWPGQSLQAAINAAAAGDNITVQTGTYDENLTITKGIDIRGTGGAVLVTGTLTITNPALPVYIADIRWGKAGAAGITITGSNSHNVRMDRCVVTNSGIVSSTGATTYFYKCDFSGVANLSSSKWTFQRSKCATVSSIDSMGNFIASEGSIDHGGSNPREITVFQSSIGRSTFRLLGGVKGWVSYSSFDRISIENGIWVIVGNVVNPKHILYVDSSEISHPSIKILGAGTSANVFNNVFDRDTTNGNVATLYGNTAIEVQNGTLIQILNNTVGMYHRGFSVISGSSVTIKGNIHRRSGRDGVGSEFSVNATPSTTISDNNFDSSINGGVSQANINADPLFTTGPNGELFWLGASSPSRNAGPSDTLFNDLDGSRNDQGAYGGHSYDPTGRTTLKPVVLSGEVSPLYVKRGGAVTITARAAVAAAP